MKTEKVKMWFLRFDASIPAVSHFIKVPLLIDTQYNVILGNSLRVHFKPLDEIECIIIQSDEFIKSALAEVETSVALEDSFERIKTIETELKIFFSTFNQNYEMLTLFSPEREKHLITNANFDRPPLYNFIKHGLRKKGDDDVGENLFSDDGELEWF